MKYGFSVFLGRNKKYLWIFERHRWLLFLVTWNRGQQIMDLEPNPILHLLLHGALRVAFVFLKS